MNRMSLLQIVVLLILCFSIISSCGRRHEAERISLEGIPEKELVMEKLMRIPGGFSPELLMLNDSVILFSYQMSSSALGVYTVGDTVIEKHSLRKKNEQTGLRVDSSVNRSFQLFRGEVLGDYTIAEGNLTLNNFVRFNFAEGRSPERLIQLDDDLYVCTGRYKEGLFGLCKREKKEMRYCGYYPIQAEYMYPDILNAMGGEIAKKGNQLVYVSRQFGFIASYRYRWGRLKKLWEKQLTDYHYRLEGRGIAFDPDQHYSGFSQVSMTDEYIYTIYNGRTKTMGLEVPNSILIFNRDGKPLFHCLLPDQMEYIGVDSNNVYVYATYSPYMNECYLVRYQLPDLLKK